MDRQASPALALARKKEKDHQPVAQAEHHDLFDDEGQAHGVVAKEYPLHKLDQQKQRHDQQKHVDRRDRRDQAVDRVGG